MYKTRMFKSFSSKTDKRKKEKTKVCHVKPPKKLKLIYSMNTWNHLMTGSQLITSYGTEMSTNSIENFQSDINFLKHLKRKYFIKVLKIRK